MEETRSLPRTIVPPLTVQCIALRSVRDRYGGARTTRENPAGGTKLKFLGCRPDSASIQEICWARASSSTIPGTAWTKPRQGLQDRFTRAALLWHSSWRQYFASLPQRQKQQNETSRACLDMSVELPGANLCTAARSRDHSMTCTAHVRRMSASALMSSVRNQCVARIFVRYGQTGELVG